MADRRQADGRGQRLQQLPHVHNSGHADRLLARAVEIENCTVCHGGTVEKKNIAAEFTTAARHRATRSMPRRGHMPERESARNAAARDLRRLPQRASGEAATPGDRGLPGPLLGVAGVSAFGRARCGRETRIRGLLQMPRRIRDNRRDAVDRSRNIRDKVSASNSVVSPDPRRREERLRGAASSAATRHRAPSAASTATTTATQPGGPHASRYAPILERNYVETDPSESPVPMRSATSAMTATRSLRPQRPHERAAMPHRRPIAVPGTAATRNRLPALAARRQEPDLVCRLPRRSRLATNGHLIDFMLRDATGKSSSPRIRRDGSTTSLPVGKGTCYLTCHGRDHNPLGY